MLTIAHPCGILLHPAGMAGWESVELVRTDWVDLRLEHVVAWKRFREWVWARRIGLGREKDVGAKPDCVTAPDVRASAQRGVETGVEDEASRQRRTQAEALLAERLQRLSRLDGAPAVDDELISYAEYQLFLDERRAAGEARQPDHWLDVCFPWGEGSAPIVGVRYQDAVAFCQWLTGRDREGWCYRLPYADEPGLEKAPRSVRLVLPPGGGYWVTAAGGEGRLVRASMGECVLRGADLAAWIERDLTAGRDLYLESALARGRDLAGALGLDPDLERAEARELALELGGALDPILERARGVDHRLAEALEQALDGARRIDYALDGGGARDLGEVVGYAQEVDRALAVAHYRTNAIPRARGLARAVSRAIDRARDLNTSVARAGASDVIRMLLLTGNRTSALDRAHFLVQDVVRDLAPAADLAADLRFAHTLGRVRELDLALMLLRACDVARPFGLDRLPAGSPSSDHDPRGEALGRELARVRAILHDPDLDHASAHAIDRAQAGDLERALARDLDLVHALSRCGELVRAQILERAPISARAPAAARAPIPMRDDSPVRAGAEALDPSRALELLVDRRLSLWPTAEWKELSRSLRQFVRLDALACAVELGALLRALPELPAEAQDPSGTRQGRLEAQREAALDVYIQLGILEDRIEGHLPAWEGVRIVGERAD